MATVGTIVKGKQGNFAPGTLTLSGVDCSGARSKLAVFFIYRTTSGVDDQDCVASVDFNTSESLTRAIWHRNVGTADVHVICYVLENPTATTANVRIVTQNANVRAVYFAVPITDGAATAFGTAVGNGDPASAAPVVSVGSAVGDLVLGCIGWFDDTITLSPDGDTTVVDEHYTGTPTGAAHRRAAIVTAAGATTATPSGTLSSSTKWVAVGLNVATYVAPALETSLAMGVTGALALTVPKPLVASPALALTGAHALTVPKPLATTPSLALTATGALTVPKPLVGAFGLVVTSSGALVVPKPLATALALALTAGPDLSAGGSGAALQAALALALTSTAALTVPKPLASALVLAVTSSGALTVPKDLAAALALTITQGADLSALGGGGALATAVSVTVTPAYLLDVPKPLTAALALALAAAGTLTIGLPYMGQVRLTAARGPFLVLYAGLGPALRITPDPASS